MDGCTDLRAIFATSVILSLSHHLRSPLKDDLAVLFAKLVPAGRTNAKRIDGACMTSLPRKNDEGNRGRPTSQDTDSSSPQHPTSTLSRVSIAVVCPVLTSFGPRARRLPDSLLLTPVQPKKLVSLRTLSTQVYHHYSIIA